MDIRFRHLFEPVTLQRGREYARRGLVSSVDRMAGGALQARVSNGRGQIYRQSIDLGNTRRGGIVDGICSCPVGYNCKHVAAALIIWSERDTRPTGLATPVQGWLSKVIERSTEPRQNLLESPQDYPDTVKDRLLYVLDPSDSRVKIDIYKGRINAAGTGLNKSIRRYDALHALRSAAPAKFIRPVDLELLAALAQARLWDASYSYGLPDLLRPKGDQALDLLHRLCATGRLLYDTSPMAQLQWSKERPEARLNWHMAADGTQRLRVEDEAGAAIEIRAIEGAAIWLDQTTGQLGCLRHPVSEGALGLVRSSPVVTPKEADALRAALPDMLDGLALPRPRTTRQIRRKATHQFARLTLSEEQARDGPRHWGTLIRLPTLTLRFVYDGHEVWDGDTDPHFVDGDQIVTLTRDHTWEAACFQRLTAVGAVPVDELESHWPGDRMTACDFVFADGEMSLHRPEMSRMRDALDFAFRVVPDLRRDGWDIIETAKWPYRRSRDEAVLSVVTQTEAGDGFHDNGWFSLGFSAEIGGKALDVAPLVAACLEQMRDDWDDSVPDVEALRDQLAKQPVFLKHGKSGYVALDLSPIAALLHLFLTHHAELGALHPVDASMARIAEEALAGSDVRFADNAGILPLARSLHALSQAQSFEAPAGLTATLRDYQAFGAAWMGSLIGAGFGAVLADDMGLGKTIQTLALLQARRAAGVDGPALLIVPTSVLHSWQVQTAQFTPDLRVLVLHGLDRKALRDTVKDADLVITTYPLLARDRDWLATRDWPLVILDEAQTLKNPASQMAKALRDIPARARLALTGTPLENSLQDLWTLMDWVVPGLLGDRKQFQAMFRTPIEKHGDAAAQARLSRRLRPFLLRRKKEEVATELPPKTEIIDRVDLPKPQQALYETVRAAMDVRVRDAIATRGLAAARITVLDALLKLRQVCCDPALVKTAAARSVTDSAKRTRLRELVGELVAEGRRVLIFSQFVEMLKLIEGDMVDMGIASLSLTGKTRNRAAVLAAFSGGDAPVFLLSLKAGGVGLTLTEADTVILYDPWWNPAVERQAMDRAHRIGQTKPVFVHRLVAAGTVEEKILDMQARKQALADALFETGSQPADTMLDEAALTDLFAPLA